MATDCSIVASLRRPRLTWNRFLAALFLFLSGLDLLLTWRLLATPGATFYEANPLAQYVLVISGWWGLSLFKMACAGTVVGVSALLAQRRPRAARTLLAVAVPILGVVVSYSLCLAGGPERREITAAYERATDLDKQHRDLEVYQQKVSQLTQAILNRRQSLSAAAQELHNYVGDLRYNPLAVLTVYYPSLNDEARLAAILVREADYLMQERGRAMRRSLLARLKAEFKSTYATVLPAPYGSRYALVNESTRPRSTGIRRAAPVRGFPLPGMRQHRHRNGMPTIGG